MRLPALMVVVAMVGCVEADIDANGYYICTEDAHCAPGKVCAHFRCYDPPAPECSPFDSAGCAADETCVTFESGPGCTTPGTVGALQSCAGDLDCGRGLHRVNLVGADGTPTGCICYQFCRDDSDCTAGTRCTDELLVTEQQRRWGPVPIGVCE